MADGLLSKPMKTTALQLEELLEADPAGLVEAVQQKVRTKLDHSEGLILFGTGQLGRITLRNLQGIGEAPLAFADNNVALAGTRLEGIPILSPEEAKAKFPKALFVITVYTNEPVRRQLVRMEAPYITFAELAWCYPDAFLPRAGLELPHKIFREASTVRAAFEILADEQSRQEYLGQIRWRSTLDPAALPPHSPVEETYYAPDVFDLRSNEVMIDCGAFDGDSIRAFLQRVGANFKAAVGLEPDPANRARFEGWRKSLPSEQASRIHLLPYATGEKRETLSFDSTGTAASAIGSGKIQVECLPLDEAVGEFEPSFIKMDIEGAEPATVRGAKQIIRQHEPILAVCLYHAQEHLWQIPLLIESLNPNYNLYLRRYADECWEIVCYAVPRWRTKV
jgi:FkbM family methyltransferase